MQGSFSKGVCFYADGWGVGEVVVVVVALLGLSLVRAVLSSILSLLIFVLTVAVPCLGHHAFDPESFYMNREEFLIAL